MNKKAQLYLIAIIAIAILFIGLVTISNYVKKSNPTSLEQYDKEIKVERRNVLNYVSTQRLNEIQTKEILTNFSKEFINKI